MEGDQTVELESSNGVSYEHNRQYVEELLNERRNLDSSFTHSARLLDQEINQAQGGPEKTKLLELHNDKPTKVVVKVKVPAEEFPRFNFIGKIIGPKGNSLRRIQEETGCRMAVFGRGSMRDKEKEEQLRQQGGKYAHLNEELHVHVESFGHPIDVYRQLSFALHELRRHLVPDYNDEVTQMQVQELAMINGTTAAPAANRGRGGRGGGGMVMPQRGGGMGGAPFGMGRGTGRGASFGSGPMRGRGGRGFPARGGPSSFRRGAGAPQSQHPQPQPPLHQQQKLDDASAAGYSESYKYEENASGYDDMIKHDYDNENQVNATGSAQQFSDFSQPSYGAESSFSAKSVQSNFSPQNAGLGPKPNAPYNNPNSNTWAATGGGEPSSFGKSPAARTTGLTRAHPYAPPAGRGGLF